MHGIGPWSKQQVSSPGGVLSTVPFGELPERSCAAKVARAARRNAQMKRARMRRDRGAPGIVCHHLGGRPMERQPVGPPKCRSVSAWQLPPPWWCRAFGRTTSRPIGAWGRLRPRESHFARTGESGSRKCARDARSRAPPEQASTATTPTPHQDCRATARAPAIGPWSYAVGQRLPRWGRVAGSACSNL